MTYLNHSFLLNKQNALIFFIKYLDSLKKSTWIKQIKHWITTPELNTRCTQVTNARQQPLWSSYREYREYSYSHNCCKCEVIIVCYSCRLYHWVKQSHQCYLRPKELRVKTNCAKAVWNESMYWHLRKKKIGCVLNWKCSGKKCLNHHNTPNMESIKIFTNM